MSQPSVRVAVQKLTRASTIASRHSLTVSMSNPSSSAVATCCLFTGAERKHIHCNASRLLSASNNNRKVVSVSSILRQDGLDIQELPILVRLLDKGEVPLPCSHAYAGEGIQPMTVEDENFQHLLRQCASVQEVFKLLEIPSDRVTGYSASAALRRMCELQKMNADWDNLHSFVRAAVMKDLMDTVRKDVAQLSNETLLSLVTCHTNMESFQQGCMSAIYDEIEKRMVEDKFALEELCSLSHLLQRLDTDDRDMINSVWVHIGNRCGDVEEEGLAMILTSLPPSHKYLLRMLGKQLHKCWWKMTADQTVACAASLVRLNSLQVGMMTDLARWLFLNIHQVSEPGLMQFVSAFIHFRFSDANFGTALERYIGARGERRLDVNLLSLAVEYCRVRRFFSPTILDAAARHFVQFGQDYSALQMFMVLRPFGQLNYMPKDSQLFLLKTEKMLERCFVDFHPAHLSELLCSFAFVERVPLNFVQRVLTPSFLSKVKGLPNSKEAGLWLEMLQSAVKLDSRGVRIPCLYKMQSSQTWKDEKTQMIQSKLQETLEVLIGKNVARIHTFAANTVYKIDAEVHLSKEGQPIPISYHGGQPSSQAAVRLAILIMAMDHYCVNSHHLLGEFAMRRRHLRKLGYTVVEVIDAEFVPLNKDERQAYMTEKLRKWVPRVTNTSP